MTPTDVAEQLTSERSTSERSTLAAEIATALARCATIDGLLAELDSWTARAISNITPHAIPEPPTAPAPTPAKKSSTKARDSEPVVTTTRRTVRRGYNLREAWMIGLEAQVERRAVLPAIAAHFDITNFAANGVTRQIRAAGYRFAKPGPGCVEEAHQLLTTARDARKPLAAPVGARKPLDARIDVAELGPEFTPAPAEPDPAPAAPTAAHLDDQPISTSIPPKPGQQVLACEDCEYWTPVGSIGPIQRHTLAAHNRSASRSERTPTPWQ